jgi:hypothetical protein
MSLKWVGSDAIPPEAPQEVSDLCGRGAVVREDVD